MTSKNNFVESTVSVLVDLISKCNTDWDEVFYRYVEDGPTYCSSEWSYRKGKFLVLYDMDEIGLVDLEDEYLDTLQNLMKNIFSYTKEESNKRPVCSVVRVRRSGEYNILFEYQNHRAMSIDLMGVGTENSLFKPGEVDGLS